MSAVQIGSRTASWRHDKPRYGCWGLSRQRAEIDFVPCPADDESARSTWRVALGRWVRWYVAMPPSRSAGTWSCVIPPGARGSPRQSVRLSFLSAQTLMPDASIDSPSSNVPRRSKRQSRTCGSLADACWPDFTGPTTFFQSAEPDTAASNWTRSALREFVTVTVTVAVGLG